MAQRVRRADGLDAGPAAPIVLIPGIMDRVTILNEEDAAETEVIEAAKTGFLVLAVGDQLMEVKNPPGFESKRW